MAVKNSKKWPDQNTDKQKQTISEHLNELRSRIVKSALVFFVFGGVGYVLHNQLISLLRKPLHQTLYYNSPAGGFTFVMKICMLTGILAAVPVVVYNLVSFIQPALNGALLRRQIRQFTMLSIVLAAAGVVFAYLMILPMSLHFFQGFQVAGVKSLISADDYLSFVINCMITFVLVSQIPLLILIIDRITPLPPSKLLHYERHVIVGALAIAIILPFTYDPVTQFVVAIPIVVLYNLSILLLWLVRRQNRLPLAPETIDSLDYDLIAHQLEEPEPVVVAPEPAPVQITPPRLVSDIQTSAYDRQKFLNDYQGRTNFLDLRPTNE